MFPVLPCVNVCPYKKELQKTFLLAWDKKACILILLYFNILILGKVVNTSSLKVTQ